MLGILAAEKSELGNLIKTLKAKIMEFNHIKYYIGQINNSQVVICCCGVGKVNASQAAMNMIINFGIDKIFNIGLAGSCKNNVPPSSVVIADKVVYHDVDLTAFNYKLNQLPEEPTNYPIKGEYVHLLKTLIKDGYVGTVSSADAIVSLNNIEAYPTLADKDILAFDMEAAAIGQVCHKTNVDFMSVKVISDNILFDSTNRNQYDTNFKTLAKKIESICLTILEYYSSIK